ncbi:MAG: hypothetical protein ACI9KE_000703 [Polyangiales bacterium]|jgi:hypothetical protein
MRLLLCTLVVSAALLALLNESSAQETVVESADQLTAPRARRANFAARASAVRGEYVPAADGALAHAERAEERRRALVEEGLERPAIRAERIAFRAMELAEMIVRRERARARIIALRREQAQVAHRLEQARSVLEHQRSLPVEFPPDPNIEAEETSDAP